MGQPPLPVRAVTALHVDAVQVGAFFAVDLDVDEVLVHEGGDGFVLEGLVRHDVAPVAGGVADAEEDGLVLGAGLGRASSTPGIPVHGVMGVLEQVGAGLVMRRFVWGMGWEWLMMKSDVSDLNGAFQFSGLMGSSSKGGNIHLLKRKIPYCKTQ